MGIIIMGGGSVVPVESPLDLTLVGGVESPRQIRHVAVTSGVVETPQEVRHA